MALTIAIEGLGVIANADAEVNDTGGDGTGDWGFTGSGGVANGLTTDTYYYGSSSMAMALSGTKNGWLWFNRGAGLNFSTTYAGQHIYFWIHCPTIGLSETLANVGVGIRIGSSTTDYRTFTVAGSDGSNGWDGGWQCFVIDPTKAGSISDGGTFDITSVQYFGIRGATTATAKGDNFFISQIAVGSGLRITGTSTTGWADTVSYCTDLPNRAWGMMQEREGIYYQYGMITIGDDATPQAAAVSFVDSGRVIQAGISEYYNISSAWVTSADIDYMGLVIEDDAAATNGVTTFTDGVVVGSDAGRSGSTIIGTANHDYSMDLYGGSNADSVTALYGTTLKDTTGVINSGPDSQHLFYSTNFIGCSQFDTASSASGAPVLRNSIFAETSDSAGALLWNNYINIQNSKFIANTTGPGIEHDTWNGTASGTATNSGSETTTLYDTAASFLSTVTVNDYVYNETDESFGRVTVIDGDDQITHTALSGGTNDYWTTSDAYSIATAYSYTDLTFSGNTYDVDSTIADDNLLAISKAGTSNPVTYPSSDNVVIQGSVTVSIHVVDTSNNDIQTAQTAVYLSSDDSQILNADTNGSGIASTTYAGSTPSSVYIRVRKSSTGDTKYIPNSTTGTIESGTGMSVTMVLREDPNA